MQNRLRHLFFAPDLRYNNPIIVCTQEEQEYAAADFGNFRQRKIQLDHG